MEWSKNAMKSSSKEKPRRLSVPVSATLEKAMNAFKEAYPERKFTDTAVLSTMIEAGFRLWAAQKAKSNE